MGIDHENARDYNEIDYLEVRKLVEHALRIRLITTVSHELCT